YSGRAGGGAGGRVRPTVERPNPPRPEQDGRGAERAGRAAGPPPERALEHHAGRGGGRRIEHVFRVYPRDCLAAPGGARRDGGGEPRPPGARRADELGHPSSRQPSVERLVQRGKAGRQARNRLGMRRSEPDVARPPEPIEEGGRGGHGGVFAFCSPYCQAGASQQWTDASGASSSSNPDRAIHVGGDTMKKIPVSFASLLTVAVVGVLLLLPSNLRADKDHQANDDQENDESSMIQIGFAIAPVKLDLQGKNRALVGRGSYIVNA